MKIKCFNTICQNVLGHYNEDGSVTVIGENHQKNVYKGVKEITCGKCGAKRMVKSGD